MRSTQYSSHAYQIHMGIYEVHPVQLADPSDPPGDLQGSTQYNWQPYQIHLGIYESTQ